MRKVSKLPLVVIALIAVFLFFVVKKILLSVPSQDGGERIDPLTLANNLNAPPPAATVKNTTSPSTAMKQAYAASYTNTMAGIDAKYSDVDKEYAKKLVTDAFSFNAAGFVEGLFSYGDIQDAKKGEQMNVLIAAAQSGDSLARLQLSHNFPEKAKELGLYNIVAYDPAKHGGMSQEEARKRSIKILADAINKN